MRCIADLIRCTTGISVMTTIETRREAMRQKLREQQRIQQEEEELQQQHLEGQHQQSEHQELQQQHQQSQQQQQQVQDEQQPEEEHHRQGHDLDNCIECLEKNQKALEEGLPSHLDKGIHQFIYHPLTSENIYTVFPLYISCHMKLYIVLFFFHLRL